MHTPEEQAGCDSHVLTEESSADAAEDRADRHILPYTISIGDVDLPAFVSGGKLYVQATLTRIFEAFAEDLPAFIRDMEIRVSGPGGRTLPLTRDGRPVHGQELVIALLGGDSEEWR
jgi:hypothetical protein